MMIKLEQNDLIIFLYLLIILINLFIIEVLSIGFLKIKKWFNYIINIINIIIFIQKKYLKFYKLL